MSKRKYQQVAGKIESSETIWYGAIDTSKRADTAMYMEAHEADLIHNRTDVAITLECRNGSLDDNAKKGSGLIALSLESHTEPLYVDRYDARLLLTTLPDLCSGTDDILSPEPLSPSGWSDMPSDTEDTFFFSPEEAEDFRRDKRRRLLDQNREERLRTLRSETGDDLNDTESIWGGSDEEPDDMQNELIRRTASHIFSSQNPAQLEMRILANHGADKRFAFLRGRWKRAWATAKARVRQNLTKEENIAKTATAPALGLDDYGDSDEEDNVLNEEEEKVIEPKIDKSVIESRQARAREWIAKRRAEKNTDSS